MTYLGKTARIRQVLLTKVPRLRAGDCPAPESRRFLFTGPPGVGKSMLAGELASALAGHSSQIEKLNGSSVSIEVVRQWQDAAPYYPLCGGMNVKIIEEIDGLKTDALRQIRTYFDDLPQHTVVLATSNYPLAKLEEQLQSRLAPWLFERVAAWEITAWLIGEFGLPPAEADRIAQASAGNVRAAKTDALSWLDAACLAAAEPSVPQPSMLTPQLPLASSVVVLPKAVFA